MEGVLVSAKREGSTVTATVVSDAKGRYSFPSSKLAPGRYSLRSARRDTNWRVLSRPKSQGKKRLSSILNCAKHKTLQRNYPTASG